MGQAGLVSPGIPELRLAWRCTSASAQAGDCPAPCQERGHEARGGTWMVLWWSQGPSALLNQ